MQLKSKKIIFICWLISNGGIENHIYNLSQLIKINHPETELFIICRYCNPNVKLFKEQKAIPIRIFYTTPFNSANVRILSTFSLLIKAFKHIGFRKADIIYSMEISLMSIVYKKIFLKNNANFILNIVGNPDSFYYFTNKTIKKQIFSQTVDTVLFETEIHKKNFNLSLKNKDFFILPHLSKIINEAPLPKNKSKLFRIAFLGRADKHKGAERLLNFFINHSMPTWSLTYYSYEGDYLNELTQISNNKKLNINIRDGWESANELRKLFQNIDLTVLWSDSEGLPLILIESLANGTPFIASDVGAIKILSHNNPYCQLFKKNDDLEEIFSNFIAFLATEKNLSEKVFHKFLELYNLKTIQKDYLNILFHNRLNK